MSKPKVVAGGPLAPAVHEFLADRVELLPWDVALNGTDEPLDGVYTYGHPLVDGAMLDRLPGVRIPPEDDVRSPCSTTSSSRASSGWTTSISG